VGVEGEVDWKAFEELAARVRRGEIGAGDAPEFEPLHPGDVTPWPAPGSALHETAARLGTDALSRGEVGCVVVAGGAGTRFGGGVKGLVPVLGDRTFLDLKLADAARVGGPHGRGVPFAVMTSPLTDGDIRAHLARASRDDVVVFRQRMLPRLTPSGETYRDARGEPSLAPAGHGDFFRALRESGAGEELRRRGVRHLAFSNVDNLAATLDPVVVGVHLQLGRPLTVEVTERRREDGTLDAGAAPVRVGTRVQLVEKVDPSQHRFISTNNLVFTLEPLLGGEIPLPWRAVRKELDGETVVQLEQVTAEVTGLAGPAGGPLLPATYLEVDRRDPRTTRFEPVKTREDLARVGSRLAARYA
jgi:UTP--glucose-1-phosphate uridylyltransferase